jgi:excisionase family DNA binding protein
MTKPRLSQSCQIETMLAMIFELQAKVAELEATAIPLPPSTDEYTTIKEAAFNSGYTASHIQNLIRKNKIVAVKQGGHVKVNVATLNDYLNRKRTKLSSDRSPRPAVRVKP